MTTKLKRALIASHSLQDFAGSEIFTLELAKELRGLGWQVSIAALLTGEPILSEFTRANFQVLNCTELASKEDTQFFDIAWIHHAPVFYEIFLIQKIQAARVIFCSLSFFVPLETPPENIEVIDILLANSAENRAFLISHANFTEKEISVFTNSAPSEYWTRSRTHHASSLKSVAVVSNHPCQEVLDAMQHLQAHGIQTAHIGRDGEQTLISPHVLLSWDAVITIGKTIPYCFALKIPVYCYDHFGGPGWLTDQVFELAAEKNFSGRGFLQKTAQEIATELAAGYPDAVTKLEALHEHASNVYDLAKNLKWVIDTPVVLKRRPRCAHDNTPTLKHHAQYMRLLKFLQARESELNLCKKEVTRIKSTVSWRMTGPFRGAYNLIRRILDLN